MPDWRRFNARKINRVVGMLLDRYHRTHGLAVVGVGRPIGTYHLYFYSLAARGEDGEPLFLPDFTRTYFLGIYQGMIGLPLWIGNDHLVHPEQEQRELGSSELLAWYEQHLTLDRFFTDHAEQIRWWRRTYHVAESESYLLTWRVMGRVAGALEAGIAAYGRHDSYGDTVAEAAAVARHGPSSRELVHAVNDMAFVFDGSVCLPDGERFDLWAEYLAGRSSAELAVEVQRQAAAIRSQAD